MRKYAHNCILEVYTTNGNVINKTNNYNCKSEMNKNKNMTILILKLQLNLHVFEFRQTNSKI